MPSYPYGAKLAPLGARNRAMPKQSGSFPVVGKGLGGIPQRAPSFPEVDYIVFYSNQTYNCDVFDKNWNRITTTKITTQPTSNASGSSEQMWMDPRQKRYLGFGSYSANTATNGSVVDMGTTPWTVYEDYTAIGGGGTGNDVVRNLAVSSSGYVIGYNQYAGDEAVCDIVTKTEVIGQPTSFTFGDGSGSIKAYGDYVYRHTGNGFYKYRLKAADAGVLLQVGARTEATYFSTTYYSSIAVASDDKRVYLFDGYARIIYVFDDTLTLLGSVGLSASGMGNGECLEISPDNKWLIAGGAHNSGSNGCVCIINTTTLAVTEMTVPVGSTNARMVGCAWYPDSDQYIVCGYGGARTHHGKRSAGGWIKNLYADLWGSNGSAFGVAIIPK